MKNKQHNKTNSQIATYTITAIIILMALSAAQGTKIWKSEASLWLNAVTLSPQGAKANNNYGNVLFKNFKTKEAIPYYKRAIESFPQYADAHYNLATSYLKTGRHKEAIPIYITYLEFEPDAVDGNFNLGFLYSQVGEIDKSISQFEKVLTLDPNNSEARNNLQQLLTLRSRNNSTDN